MRLAAALFVAAILSTALFGSQTVSAAPVAADAISGLFGTVVQVGEGGISLSTDDGLVTIQVGESTSVKIGADVGSFGDIQEGDRVATTAIDGADGAFVAQDLLVRSRTVSQTRHFVGVVLDVDDGQVQLIDSDGRTINFDLPAQVDSPAVGEAITIVARVDQLTNRLIVSATESQEQTVARLEEALQKLAQTDAAAAGAKIEELQSLVEENGRRHLSALQNALTRVRKGDDEEIRANLIRLYSIYTATADSHGLEAPGVRVSGTVSELTDNRITVTDDAGANTTYSISSDTRYTLDRETRQSFIGPVQAISIAVGDAVNVEFSPIDSDTAPAATRITIRQPHLSPELVETLTASESRRFEGVITRVDDAVDLDNATGVVMLTNQDDGGKIVLKTRPDTVIELNGMPVAVTDLAPGFAAAVELDSQGLNAISIDAFRRLEREQHVRGVVERVDLDNHVVTIAPEKGSPIVVSVPGEFALEKDGKTARLSGLEVGDLVLNATRFDVQTGEVTNLVVNSPRVPVTGVVRGVDRESHSITIETSDGDQVRIFVLTGTLFSDSDGLRSSLSEVQVADVVRQGEFRIAEVQGAARNVADLLVIQSAKQLRARGVVAGVDADGGILIVDSTTGELLDLTFPTDDRRVKVVKDDVEIDSLAPVKVGDVVGLVVYVEDTKSIVSASLVTAGARGATGRIQAVNPRSRILVVTTPGGETLRVLVGTDTHLVRQNEDSNIVLYRAGDTVSRLLYVPVFGRDGLDGNAILIEAVPGDSGRESLQPGAPDTVTRLLQTEFRLSGTIHLVSDNIWRIDRQEFAVTDTTATTGGGLEDGSVGSVVVRGLGEGTFEALAIRISAPAPDSSGHDPLTSSADQPVEITTTISFIEDRTIFADGRRFILTPATVVDGELKVGAVIKATIQRGDDGTLQLISVSVLSR